MKPVTAPTDIVKRLFTVDDAAAYLSIGKRSMWRLISDGEVRKTPIGSRTLVDRADLDEYVERVKRSA